MYVFLRKNILKVFSPFDSLIFIFLLTKMQQERNITMSQSEKRVNKANWTPQEQELLRKLRQQQPGRGWKSIVKQLNDNFPEKNRTNKQCRQRYMNYLRFGSQGPKLTGWTASEDGLLFEKYIVMGPKWALISTQMPGRSQNCLKNRFHSILRKIMRKITKGEKISKNKYKKPIKYNILTQILNQRSKMKSDRIYKKSLLKEQRAWIFGLALELIMLTFKTDEQITNQEIFTLIDNIHKYNLVLRDAVFRNKSNRENGSQEPEMPDQEEESDDEELNFDPNLFKFEANKAGQTQHQSIDDLEDLEDDVNPEIFSLDSNREPVSTNKTADLFTQLIQNQGPGFTKENQPHFY